MIALHQGLHHAEHGVSLTTRGRSEHVVGLVYEDETDAEATEATSNHSLEFMLLDPVADAIEAQFLEELNSQAA